MILKKTKPLLEALKVTSQFLSDHLSNLLPLNGKLAEEKGEMIQMIEGALRRLKEDTGLGEEMESRHSLTSLWT